MMKHLLICLTICLVGLFVILGFTGCKGPEGPTGPQGLAGANGANGTNGTNGLNAGFVYFDGFKDSLRCAGCHDLDKDTVNYIAARDLQTKNSGHNSMGDFDENRGACAACHTTEGFIIRVKNGNNQAAVTDRFDPTPVGCFACHAPHIMGNFGRRITTPVTLLSNIVGVPSATFDDGDANLCAQCHQARSSASGLDISKQAATDTLKITSNRYGPHHGLQPLLLYGKGGVFYEFAGYTYNNSVHQVLASQKKLACPDCHMADASPSAVNAGKVGGHTMNIAFTEEGSTTTTYNANACNLAVNGSTCHSAGTKIAATGVMPTALEHNGKVKAVSDSLTALYNALGKLGWLDTVSTSSTYGLVKAKTGTLSASNPLVIVPAKKGGALWNYILIHEDRSTGIHNSQYALDILTASLAELRK